MGIDAGRSMTSDCNRFVSDADRELTLQLPEDFMSTIASPDQSPATSSRSASALNLIGGTWAEGRGNTSRDIYNPADRAEVLAPVREAAPEQVDEACAPLASLPWLARHSDCRIEPTSCSSSRSCWKRTSSDVAHSIVREKTASC